MTKGKSGLKRLTIAEQRALGRGEQLESSFEADDRNGAIIYARVSSDDSAKSNLSIPDQLKQSRKLCDRNAWQILNEYVDEGRSAFLEEVVRPQFEKMIADVETGLYPTLKYVVFYHSSRLARRTEVFSDVDKRLKACGVEIVSVTQHFSDDEAGFSQHWRDLDSSNLRGCGPRKFDRI